MPGPTADPPNATASGSGARGGVDALFQTERARASAIEMATDVAASLLPYLYDAEPSSRPTIPGPLARDVLAKGDELADALAGIVRGVVGPLADYLEQRLAGQHPGGQARGIDVECIASPGQVATAMATMVAPSDLQDGRVWTTTLHHPAGHHIDSSHVRCLPGLVTSLSAGTSLPLRVVIEVPSDAHPGRYVGVLLCTALAQEVASIHLDVTDGDVAS